MIGETLSHYRITAKLGEGGMGVVYRADDTRLDREVALKILPEEFTQDHARRARLQREARLLASFSHPHIASIFSLDEDRGRCFLVLELVDGQDLSDLLAHGPLVPARALDCAHQIATALEVAHCRGIVHRDLKPQNVKLTADGRVKVLDFGLAKAFLDRQDPAASNSTSLPPSAADGFTLPGTILGSPAYMSPEQSKGEDVDKRTDIWAFGCLLYEMLTGRKAFAGNTFPEALAAILTAEPAWSELPDGTHPAVARLLRRCLRKDPQNRLHDIADARIVIGEVLMEMEPDVAVAKAMEPVGEQQVSRRLTGDRGRPRRALLWVSLFGWLCTAGLAVLAVILATRASAPPQPVRLRTLTFSGRDWAPSASPDGRLIAFTSGRAGIPQIWLKQMRGGGEEPLTRGCDDLARFSPDGSQILFVRDEEDVRNLYRMNVVGGQPRKLLNDVLEADWSPDGTHVAFLRGTPVGSGNMVILGIAEIRTGDERHLTRVENRLCYGVRWARGGRWITMNEASLTGNVADESYIDLVNPDTGELQQLSLTDWNGPYTAIDWLPGKQSFLVGQAADVLAHVSGSMGQIMLYDLESTACSPLFWSSIRVPRQGWNTSSLNLVDGDRVVFDDLNAYAELREIALGSENPDDATRVLTSGLAHDRQPAFSPDGRQVIFSTNRSGNVDLWTVDRISGDIRQLTDDPADDWDPAFTPDGRSILWSSNRSGNLEIWMATAAGSHARQVTRDGVDAENPTMTTDGRWIVYTSSNDAKLGVWKIHPDGTGASLLVAGNFNLPEVSPDGRFALYSQFMVQNTLIQVVEIESGEQVDFSIDVSPTVNFRNTLFGRARWTDGGRTIFYIGQDEKEHSGVFAQAFVPGQDTSASRRKIAGFAWEYVTESLGVSPDGEHLVISARFDRQCLKLADVAGLLKD